MSSRATGWHFAAFAVEIALAGVIALFLLVLAWAYNVRFDLTPTQEHTLSDPARRALHRLNDDVTITVFYNSQDQGRVREVKQLLQRFREQSSHVTFKMYDLDRSPLLANRFGIVNYNTAVMEGANRVAVIGQVDESQLTTQLLKLIEGRQRIALFTIGHGEADPSDPDDRRGLSQVAKALEAENYRIDRSSDLRGGIPAETALLVVAAPQTDFSESEIATVRTYLEQGGGAFFLLEAGSPQRIQALVREFGFDPGNDLIVDERNRLFFADSFAPQVAFFNEQVMPYTGAPPAILPVAQSVSVVQPANPNVKNAPLAFTGDDTWVDTERVSVESSRPVFREGIDRVGPVPVAAIAHVTGEQDEQRGSIIVIGDGSFATNLYAGSLGNRDLFLNLSHLAARAEALMAVREVSRPGGTFSQIFLTAEQGRALFWVGVVLLPGVVLLFGAFVGWRRRARSAG